VSVKPFAGREEAGDRKFSGARKPFNDRKPSGDPQAPSEAAAPPANPPESFSGKPKALLSRGMLQSFAKKSFGKPGAKFAQKGNRPPPR